MTANRIMSLIPGYAKLLDHNHQFQRKLVETQNELKQVQEDRDRFKALAQDYTNRYECALNTIEGLREKYEPELVEAERKKIDTSFGMPISPKTQNSVHQTMGNSPKPPSGTRERANTSYNW